MPSQLTFKRDYYSEVDQLGFDRYVKTLGDMITDKNFQTPFCIGIHGKWGSGKTSFMRQLEKDIAERNSEPVPIPVWFNPWRYSKEEHLIIPFLKTIAASLTAYAEEQQTFTDKLKSSAEDISNAARAIAYGAKLNFFGIALSGKDAIEREAALNQEKRDDIEKLQDDLKDIYYNIIEHLQKAVSDKEFRLVIFIDDLDRCIPEKAVELLESIKLFLDLEGYLFILGVDREVVEEGILHHYSYEKVEAHETRGKELAGKYLEKMIQMGLELPPIEPSRKRNLIESLLEESSVKDQTELIDIGIEGKPRDIVRFINYLAFFCRLAENLKPRLQEETINGQSPEGWSALIANHFTPEFYTKWAILQYGFREQHKQIIDANNTFFQLQNQARPSPEKQIAEKEKEHEPALPLPDKLQKVLAHGEPFEENLQLIRKFIYLAESVSQVVIEQEEISERTVATKAAPHELPEIGTMVKIPSGPFLFGEKKEEISIKEPFEIDIYPVTNLQFIEYLNEWYSGKAEPKDQDGNKIIHWSASKIGLVDSAKFSSDDSFAIHPVTGMTWHGAKDFCRWRTEKEKQNSNPFRLPTEEEWEKAARGDNGREYPWGDTFESALCNTEESGLGGTSKVTQFPEGKSPYYCFDMAGNVWEWTESKHERSRYYIKGGSWLDVSSAARCPDRFRFDPTFRSLGMGFRCARTIKK